MKNEILLPALLGCTLAFTACSSEPAETNQGMETPAADTVSFKVSGMT